MDRFLLLIKSLLSLGTTFIFLRILHPAIILRPITEWTWHNLFYGYNFWFLGIFAFILSLIIFYLVLPWQFSKIVNDKLLVKYNKIYESLGELDKKEIIVFFGDKLKKGIKTLIKYGFIKEYHKFNKNDSFSYSKYRDSISSFLSMIIHIIICLIFIKPLQILPFFLLVGIVLLIGIILLLLSPMFYYLSSHINNFLNHELNRNIEQIPD